MPMTPRPAGIDPRHFRRLAAPPADPAGTDRELLRRFADWHDEAAFEAVVRRHGPMVLAAARRALGGTADAEDVCQAAFLLLARKAAGRWQPSVAGWLHRTAHLLALKARRGAARRARREGKAAAPPPADPLAGVTGRELLTALDEELLALPESLRGPLVLCYLEGATRDEAAGRLGCPLATLKKRLERGRGRLHAALTRRGFGLSAVLLGAVATAAPATPPHETAAAAIGFAAGVGAVASKEVGRLVTGGLGMTGSNAIKGILAAVLLGSLVAAGTVSSNPPAEQPAPKAAAEPVPAAATSAGTLRVVVLDPHGKPLPGASVHASIWTDEKDFKANQELTADAAGAAVVALPKSIDILRLWAAKDGHATLFANWERSDLAGGKAAPAEYTFRLEAAGSAGGRVLDDRGRPVAGARVEVQLANEPKPAGGDGRVSYQHTLGSATTDAEGRWRVTHVPTHPEVDLVLRATHPDYVTPERWTRAKPAGIAAALRAGTAALTLTPGVVVRGRVTGPAGQPLKDAAVVRGDDPYLGSPTNTFATDADGRYRLPALPAGVASVTVLAPGFAPQLRRVDVKADLPPQDFRLGPGKPVRVRFVDAAGRPVPGVHIWLREWKKSKSIDSNQNPNHPKRPDTGIPGKADADGFWAWPAAPDEAVRVSAQKRGFLAAEFDVTGGGPEQTVTLKAEHRVTGSVTDAATGKPVPSFAIIPIDVFGKDHLHAERDNAVDGRDGRLNFLATRTDIPLRLRVEAPGYRSTDGPEFRVGDAGGRVQDFRLHASPPVTGRVVGADGKPVSKSEVLVATPTDPVRSYGGNHRVYTGAAGGFTFPDPGEPFAVVVRSDAGTATAEFPAGRADAGTLTVRPWAAVRGTFRDGGKPVAGATVFAGPIRLDGLGRPRIDHGLQAVTGADGRFEFPRVPPGPTHVRVSLGPWEDKGFRSGPNEPLDLKPGGAVDLQLGSGGATVSGRVKLTGTVPAGLDCQYSLNYLVRREPGVVPPPAVAAAGFDARTGWRDAWGESAEGRAYLATLKHWFVKLAADGSFRVSGVPAGEYDLAVRVYAKPEGCLVEPLARRVVRVTVTTADAARGGLTLLAVEAEVRPLPAVGDTPALSFTRADGSAGTLADVRGRYAVVHFWAGWCAPCKKQLPAVAGLHERYRAKGLAVLSVSLDEDAAAWQAAAKAAAWPQGRLGSGGSAVVASVPTYWLLDPAGKIVAKPLDAESLAEAVAERLKK